MTTIALVIGTIDRTPGPHYLAGLVRSLRRSGLWTCGLLHDNVVQLVDGGSGSVAYIGRAMAGEDRWNVFCGDRGQHANETFAQMARVGVETDAEWVVTLEEDVLVAEDFLSTLTAWLQEWASPQYPMFPLYCPYRDVLEAHGLKLQAYQYPISSFYGTQGCVWRREMLASYLAWYEAEQRAPVRQERPYFWDLLIKDWAAACCPQAPYFLTPVPSLVQHVGRFSALGLHANFHEAPCVAPLADPIDITRASAISGWMAEPNLRWFAEQAMTHQRICEVGTFVGRTTRALADHAPGFVVTIDDFHGSRVEPDAVDASLALHGRDQVIAMCVANLKDHLETGKAQLLEMDSITAAHELLTVYGSQSFDMVVLDASHDLASVRADLAAYYPLLAPGGLLCGDDYGFPGVRQAVDEAFATVEVINGWLWVGKEWRGGRSD